MSDGRRHVGIIEQRLDEFEKDVRSIAHQLARTLPASIDAADLEQAGRIGVWEALARHDGRAAWRSYAGIRARGAMLDYLRSTYPGGRRAQAVFEFVGEDSISNLAAPADAQWGGDPAVAYERKQTALGNVEALSDRQRGLVVSMLDGQAMQDIAMSIGVSGSRVSQQLNEVVGVMESANRAPLKLAPRLQTKQSSPWDVPILSGSMPPPPRRQSGAADLMGRMRATQSVRVSLGQSKSLMKAMRLAGLDSMACRRGDGVVEVWREPSPAQRAARGGKK